MLTKIVQNIFFNSAINPFQPVHTGIKPAESLLVRYMWSGCASAAGSHIFLYNKLQYNSPVD